MYSRLTVSSQILQEGSKPESNPLALFESSFKLALGFEKSSLQLLGTLTKQSRRTEHNDRVLRNALHADDPLLRDLYDWTVIG